MATTTNDTHRIIGRFKNSMITVFVEPRYAAQPNAGDLIQSPTGAIEYVYQDGDKLTLQNVTKMWYEKVVTANYTGGAN